MSGVVAQLIALTLQLEPDIVPKIATTPDTADGYGRDLVCIDDLDPRAKETDPNSLETLAQDLYHRVSTSRGQMPDDPDYGIDLIEFLHRPTTTTELLAMAGVVSGECRKDDRVSDVETTVTFDSKTDSLSVSIDVTPKDPDLAIFKLIIVVIDGATLLQEIIS